MRLGQANQRQGGFSYVGLLILVGLLGALCAAAVTAGAAMERRAAEGELLFIGGQFRQAFKSYYLSTPAGQPYYPRRLSDLLRDPRSTVLRRHLRQIYADPLTGQRTWGIQASPDGGIMGVYSRSAETPIKVAGFDPEFESFTGATRYAQWVFGYAPPMTPVAK